MSSLSPPCPPDPCVDHNRLEAVTVCAGFDDVARETLARNHAHFDTLIVVTTHDDLATQKACRQLGIQCVPTDVMTKDGRKFNKGAMINVGFQYFRFKSWRCHLDIDILVPDNFRRVLQNRTCLEEDCLYGADRVDLIGLDDLHRYDRLEKITPQLANEAGLSPLHYDWESRESTYADGPSASGTRYVHPLFGYCPIGFFQLWHASRHKSYPYPSGDAAGDDVRFAALWPECKRRVLPTAFMYHLNARSPAYGENWNGPTQRGQPRLDGKKEKKNGKG